MLSQVIIILACHVTLGAFQFSRAPPTGTQLTPETNFTSVSPPVTSEAERLCTRNLTLQLMENQYPRKYVCPEEYDAFKQICQTKGRRLNCVVSQEEQNQYGALFGVVSSSDGGAVCFGPTPQMIPVDREMVAVIGTFKIKCSASNENGVDHIESISVYVSVGDADDNKPVFTNGSYNITVREFSVYRIKLVATDADIGDNAAVTYKIVSRPIVPGIVINEMSGLLTIQGLNATESWSAISLDIEAISGLDPASNMTAATRVTINVEDKNEPPQCRTGAARSVYVNLTTMDGVASALTGKSFPTAFCFDSDRDAEFRTVVYRLEAEGDSKYFTMPDAKTGSLRIVRALPQNRYIYNLTVTAGDTDWDKATQFTVILEIIGLSPVCPQSISRRIDPDISCVTFGGACETPYDTPLEYRLEKIPPFLSHGDRALCLNDEFTVNDEGPLQLYLLSEVPDLATPTRFALNLNVTLSPRPRFIGLPKNITIRDDISVKTPILRIYTEVYAYLSIGIPDDFRDFFSPIGSTIRVARPLTGYPSETFTINIAASVTPTSKWKTTATVVVNILNINTPPSCALTRGNVVTLRYHEGSRGNVFILVGESETDFGFIGSFTGGSGDSGSFRGGSGDSGSFTVTTTSDAGSFTGQKNFDKRSIGDSVTIHSTFAKGDSLSLKGDWGDTTSGFSTLPPGNSESTFAKGNIGGDFVKGDPATAFPGDVGSSSVTWDYGSGFSKGDLGSWGTTDSPSWTDMPWETESSIPPSDMASSQGPIYDKQLPTIIPPDSGLFFLNKANCNDTDNTIENAMIVYDLKDTLPGSGDSKFFSIDPLGVIEFDTRGLTTNKSLFLVTYTAGDIEGFPRPLRASGTVGILIKDLPMSCQPNVSVRLTNAEGLNCQIVRPCQSPYEQQLIQMFLGSAPMDGAGDTENDAGSGESHMSIITYQLIANASTDQYLDVSNGVNDIKICLNKSGDLGESIETTFHLEAHHDSRFNESQLIDVNFVFTLRNVTLFLEKSYSTLIDEVDAIPGTEVVSLSFIDSALLTFAIAKEMDNYFTIDGNGTIALADQLAPAVYNFEVVASDPNSDTDRAEVEIRVLMASLNCTMRQHVSEFDITTLVSELVATLVCVDPGLQTRRKTAQLIDPYLSFDIGRDITERTWNTTSVFLDIFFYKTPILARNNFSTSVKVIRGREDPSSSEIYPISYSVSVEIPKPVLRREEVTDNTIHISWNFGESDFEEKYFAQIDHFILSWKNQTTSTVRETARENFEENRLTFRNNTVRTYILGSLAQNTTYWFKLIAVQKDSYYADKESDLMKVTTIAQLIYEIRLTFPLTFQADLLDRNSAMFKTYSADLITDIERSLKAISGTNEGLGLQGGEFDITRFQSDQTDSTYVRSYVNYFAIGSLVASVNVIMNGANPERQFASANTVNSFVQYVQQSGKLGDYDVTGILATAKGDETVDIIGQTFATLPLLANSTNLVTCEASVSGPAAPVFAWYLGSAKILNAGNARVFFKGAVRNQFGNYESGLIVTKLRPKDSGNITCLASIGNTIANSSTIEANVLPLPVVSVTPKAKTVRNGGSISIECVVGYPSYPNILIYPINVTWVASKWIADKDTVVSTDGKDDALPRASDLKTVNTASGKILKVTNLRTDVIFTCIGSNQAGEVKVNSQIAVLDKSESTCPAEVGPNGISWSATREGITDAQPCMSGYSGVAYRRCVLSGGSVAWGVPNLTSCTSERLAAILEGSVDLVDGIQSTTIKQTAAEIKTFTSQGTQLVSGDIAASLKTIENLVTAEGSQVEGEDATEQDIIESASNILDEKYESSWLEIEKLQPGASELMKDMGDYGKTISRRLTTDVPKVIPSKNVVLQAEKTNTSRLKGTTSIFPDVSLPGMPTWTNTDNQIKLEGDAVFQIYGDSEVSFSALQYRTISRFLSNETDSTQSKRKFVNSDTLALSIEPAIAASIFDPPITLVFQHSKTSVNYTNGTCSYWDYDYRGTPGGAWSSDGCVAVTSTADSTTCECNHLTNFAILMSLTNIDKALTVPLSYLTQIGCGISIACLVVTVTLYAIYWKKIKSDRSIIHLNLCVAIILADTTFLAGVEQTQIQAVCKVVAALLHFFFLAVFMFMLIEGVELYILLVKVFDVGSSRAKWYIIAGWGVPAAVVGISLGITQTNGYGNEDYCWLSLVDGLLWTFVGPALGIIVVNFIFLFLALRAMFKTKVIEDKTRAKRAKAGVRALFILVPLLGLTWVFGVFAVNNSTIIFQYLFTIFNSLQGLFIFIVHCLMNKQLQKIWCKKRLEKSSKTSKSHSSQVHQNEYGVASGQRSRKVSFPTEQFALGTNSQTDSSFGITNPSFDEKEVDCLGKSPTEHDAVLVDTTVTEQKQAIVVKTHEGNYDNAGLNNSHKQDEGKISVEIPISAEPAVDYEELPSPPRGRSHPLPSPTLDLRPLPAPGEGTSSTSGAMSSISSPASLGRPSLSMVTEPVPDYDEPVPDYDEPGHDESPVRELRSPSFTDLVQMATKPRIVYNEDFQLKLTTRKQHVDNIHSAGEALRKPTELKRRLTHMESENVNWNKLRIVMASPEKKKILLARLRLS
ncbi:uncharacterized protein LOC135499704 [Lineus longissimus]|uniref:uncharacterized protein LOC135499704 n=1 Tax=Lineus longissimus TaxID=88925 RepID=UPI002B4C6B79